MQEHSLPCVFRVNATNELFSADCYADFFDFMEEHRLTTSCVRLADTNRDKDLAHDWLDSYRNYICGV